MFIICDIALISKFAVPFFYCVISYDLEWVLADIYIYIYIYVRVSKIKRPRCVKLFFSVYLEGNDLVVKLFHFINFCFNFHLEVT